MNQKKIIGWSPLQVGDTVDIVAPGFKTTDDKFQGALKFLDQVGLKARYPQDLFGPDLLCSQKDDIRLRHLKEAFQNSESKAIWCLRAGYGAIRLIENFAKFSKPKKNKIFIGYSDSTTLHNHLNQFWNFSSLHAPLLDRLGQANLPVEQVEELMDVLFARRDLVEFKDLTPLNKSAGMKKIIRAPVVGGNLKVLESSLGTRFYREPRGQIVFFEDIGERGYRVDRMLIHLRQAGFFSTAKAVVFGEFTEGKEPTGESLVEPVLQRFANEMKIPVFAGAPAGHGTKQRPVPLYTSAVLYCGSTGVLKMATGAEKQKPNKNRAK